MATISINYPSSSTTSVTITSLNSLATNASAGVFTKVATSTPIDNTSNNDIDHLLSGTVVVGASGLTANRGINIFVIGAVSESSGTPSWPDTIDGTDDVDDFTSANTMAGVAKCVAAITIDSTGSRAYAFGPVSVAQAFGGNLPQHYVIAIGHDTGAALAASGHSVQFQRVKLTVA